MPSTVNVAIHSSQSPENVRRDLLESLRTKRVNHKFHYDSPTQTEKWLALHQVFSPSRNDPYCEAVYENAVIAAAAHIPAEAVHVIGLGCGGGKKDSLLLNWLEHHNKQCSYTPCDVSRAMVRVAQQATAKFVLPKNCFPFVCDLATATDLQEVFSKHGPPQAARVITFFGMIPNFEPDDILPKLSSLVRPGDRLLFSANLSPGRDYLAGLERVLPQYDNEMTKEWLAAFLFEKGVEAADGEIRVTVERSPSGIGKIAAWFHFKHTRQIEVMQEKFEFRKGDDIRLFYSYRYTPELIGRLLSSYGIEIQDQWITKSEEEGVFLCRRT